MKTISLVSQLFQGCYSYGADYVLTKVTPSNRVGTELVSGSITTISVSVTTTQSRTPMFNVLTAKNGVFQAGAGWQSNGATWAVPAGTDMDEVTLMVKYSDESNIQPSWVTQINVSYEGTLKLPWKIGADNYPTRDDFLDLPSAAIATPYPHALWRIESGYNEGRPFNMLLPDISNIVPWVQPSEPVIHVYSSRDTEFTTNGYAILEPISCEVHHEGNGVYEATLETYCDEYNKFTYVKKQAQIRIPLKYHGETNHQIFRIRECTRRMDEQGNYRIVATAQHKFYDLTRYMIEDCRPTSLDGDAALTWLFTHGWYGNETDDEFTYSSDITNSRTAYYQNMNVVNALLGADQCFVNRWGGKLFRDNTYFSLNNTMENARDAGVICYGYNMTEIELVENDSDLITVLIAEDNYGNKYTLTNESVPTEAIPHHIYGYARFTYDAEDVDAFHADAQAYFDEHKQSSLNLTVRFANLSDIDLYKDFLALDDYEVGDHITVYHKDLDIFYANLEIISKTFDVVSQKTSEIQIGSLRSAITSRPFMSQTVSSGNTVEDKQYISLDDQLDEVAFFAVVQYPISTEDDKLLVTSDGKYLQYQP